MSFQRFIKCLFEHWGATYKLQKYCKRPNKHHSPKPIVQFFNLITADILHASHEMVLAYSGCSASHMQNHQKMASMFLKICYKIVYYTKNYYQITMATIVYWATFIPKYLNAFYSMHLFFELLTV